MRWWFFVATLAGCRSMLGLDDPTPLIDAPIPDAAEATCATAAQGTALCVGRTRRVCGADHDFDPSLDETCDFTCSLGQCVTASNFTTEFVQACSSMAPALTPPLGATVTIGADKITCSPTCDGNTITSITATNGLVCVSKLDLDGSVMVKFATGQGSAMKPTSILVDDTAWISTTIPYAGGDATASIQGMGGPGGYDGAPLAQSAGNKGGGPCGGAGGTTSGPTLGDDWVGGGGGGGGNQTVGGIGGKGECRLGNHNSDGGNAGAVCSTDELVPLVGGSGGGGGGDASSNGQFGYPGGGGGGALQISSRISITLTGSIDARGGKGYGTNTIDGGGGGGAGGAILLEAPTVTVNGPISVDGGQGGPSGSGPGGIGATLHAIAASGLNFVGVGQGGSGGGGGGGRIRIHSSAPQCTSQMSPASACTTDTLGN
ncbi:MAG: hypothetical protein QM831_18280 [Kofleriaceae bacterium]